MSWDSGFALLIAKAGFAGLDVVVYQAPSLL